MNPVRNIVFRLSATVNGTKFRMDGDGTGDPIDGSCTLRLEASPQFPEGFDPVSCPMICSHPTSLYFSRVESGAVGLADVAGGAYAVRPARRGAIYDQAGRQLLGLEVTSRLHVEGDRLVGEHTMHGHSHLPALSHNDTPLEDHLLPAGDGAATAVARFGLITRDGELLDGITTVPYAWDGAGLPAALVRTVEHLDVEWDGHRRVVARYRTSLRTLEDVGGVPELVTA